MLAATIDLIVVLVLGVGAIHALGIWARSPVTLRSPKFQRQVSTGHHLGNSAHTTR